MSKGLYGLEEYDVDWDCNLKICDVVKDLRYGPLMVTMIDYEAELARGVCLKCYTDRSNAERSHGRGCGGGV